MRTRKNRLVDAVLMSTHKICFSKNKKNVKILRFFLSLFLIFAKNL